MIQLGSIRGTTITLDFSFLFIVALFVITSYNPNIGIHYALLWIPVLFLSILLHELAHAGMIGLFGFGSSQIVLGGMGGVTINRRQARPWQDMLISLAGPASSFALAALVRAFYRNSELAQRDPMLAAFLPLLIIANVFWGIFNCLPISPLDGGHALRDLLRIFMPDRKAFPIAIWIGIVVGVVVAILGLLARQIFVTVLLAWFVFMNYQQWQYYRDHGTPGD
ncbi:MAG TPA: M50 family metallopeptidase [Thermoanaerobaculia bacterium]|nr:M50 family metallopeptidase [Thermoanaerobaculia bacterium]